MDVIVIVIGETLESGSAAVEAVGSEIAVDMARCWQADDAFFECLRDKEVLTRIVAEVAGEPVAKANANETGKVLKGIIRDRLDGTNGRPKVDGRSEEHTSELQSLMRNSYAVFCLKKKNNKHNTYPR